MSEEADDKLIGEDGLDLNDTKAVANWTRNKLNEHERAEKRNEQMLRDHGVDPDGSDGEKIDMSGLNSELRKEFEDILTELEQRENKFKLELATAGKGGGGSSSQSRRINKWKSL